MDEIKVPESDGKQTVQPTKLDLDVKVFPSQRDGNLLASANITLGGCFAVKGLRVMNGRNGPFVAMPDWKDSGQWSALPPVGSRRCRSPRC